MEAPVEHLVTLKVMRLTRPTLISPLVVTCDSKDLPTNLLNNELKQDVTAVPGMETINAGQFLLLPQSFGNIYLGETFSSYICVYNETDEFVNNVSVKAVLQTKNQNISLTSERSVEKLGGDDTVSDVIHHEVKEIGTHILICEVSYLSKLNTPVTFRKFFKFMVVKPLDVKTKFYSAESDEVYLEAQVQNITSGTIYLEKVVFDASQLFTVNSLNTLEDGTCVFGETNELQRLASCQFLYCLKPHPNFATDLQLLSNTNNIGKLDIIWRSNLGERGRLQTSQLEKMSPEYPDIRMIVQDIPNCVVVEKTFYMTCKIVNTSTRKMELSLELDPKSSLNIAWACSSGYKVGQLEGGTSTSVTIGMVPLKCGLLIIGGIRLLDSFLQRTYDYENIAQVFVMRDFQNEYIPAPEGSKVDTTLTV